MTSRVVTAIALTFAPAVFAQSYIVPEQECGSVVFHLTHDASFPSLGQSPAAIDVVRAQLYVPGSRIDAKPTAGAASLDFTTTNKEDQLALIAVQLAPTIVANETQTESVKAMVGCGEKRAKDGRRLTAGLRLEIIPQWNEGFPLEPGHDMRFIAVDNTAGKGELVRTVRMELFRQGSGSIYVTDSDRHGIVKFPETQPGRYLVIATYRRPDPSDASRWLVDFSSLTFDVKR